jgi:hypothetical protein
MSHWVLEYRYTDPDARARVRPDHLAYMNGLHEDGRVVMGGPVGDGGGALVVLRRFGGRGQAIIAADPYGRWGQWMRGNLLGNHRSSGVRLPTDGRRAPRGPFGTTTRRLVTNSTLTTAPSDRPAGSSS